MLGVGNCGVIELKDNTKVGEKMILVIAIDNKGSLRDCGFVEGTKEGIQKELEEMGWHILEISDTKK